MQRLEPAYRAGIAEAERDIAAGRPKRRYSARGAWRDDLAPEGAHGTSGTIGKSDQVLLMFSNKIPPESLIA